MLYSELDYLCLHDALCHALCWACGWKACLRHSLFWNKKTLMCFRFQFQLRNPWMLGTFLCVPAKLVPSVLLTMLTSLLFVSFTLSECPCSFSHHKGHFPLCFSPQNSHCQPAERQPATIVWQLGCYIIFNFPPPLPLPLPPKKRVGSLSLEFNYKLAEYSQIHYRNVKWWPLDNFSPKRTKLHNP